MSPHPANLLIRNVTRYLVFHGGSGSTKDEISTAVSNGVVKMNVDTDTQFAYLVGVRVRSTGLSLATAIAFNELNSGLRGKEPRISEDSSW